MDIAKPLKQGFWVGFGSREAFITILYESLPVFCFNCGLVGHAVSSCPDLGCSPSTRENHRPVFAPAKQDGLDSPMLVDGATESVPCPSDPSSDQSFPPDSSSLDPVPGDSFGPWMVVQHRRKRGGGSPSSGFPRSRPQPRDPNATWNPVDQHARHVPPLRVPQVPSSRGGRGGRGGRGFSPRDFPPFRDSYRSDLNLYPEAAGGSCSSFQAPASDSFDDCFSKDPDPLAPSPLINDPDPMIDSGLIKGKAVALPLSPTLPSPPSRKAFLLPKTHLIPLSPLPPNSSTSPSLPAASLLDPPPLLLSSSPLSPILQGNFESGLKTGGISDCSASHLDLVQKVASALCPSPSSSAPLGIGDDLVAASEEAMAASDSSGEIDGDSTLFQFQKEIKACSKKDSRRSKTSKKLGRLSDPY